MDETTLGKNAGIVWEFLADHRERGASIATIKKIPGLRPDDAVAAVGWLAREGKLRFERGKRSSLVRLVDHPLLS